MAESVVSKGNLVEEWVQGNARVRIYDDAYANKSPEEIQEIVNRVYRKCKEIVNVTQRAGNDI